MEYNAAAGAWLNTEKVEDGAKVKLVSECAMVVSRFKDDDGNPKTDNNVKVQFAGEKESVNMRLNWTTVYGLIAAFGKESKDWMGHTLTAHPKDATTGISIYLVAEGFELFRNDKKRWEIRKIESAKSDDGYPEYEGEPTI